MTGLGAFAQVRVFQFDEVTHMRAGFQHGTWTQTSERTGIAAFAQDGTFDMAVGLDDHAFAQGAVLDHAVRADHHVVFDDDLTFEDHVDVDQHVAANRDVTANVETSRVTQRHTLSHQTTTGAQLIMPFQFGKLLAIVGALHFHGVVRLLGGHHQTIAHGHGNDVGQVVLALGVVIGETAHPVAKTGKRQRQNAGIAFGDFALGFIGIFLLDNGRDLALHITNNAAVTGRVIQLYGQQAQLLWPHLLEQTLQGIDFDQRHIAIKHQHGVGLNERHGLSNGVTGTQLLILQDEVQIIRRQTFAHGIGAVADHHVNALWIKLPGAVDNMAEHGVAGNRVQNFRQSGTHARALASSENNDFKRHDWLPILGGQRLRPGCKNRKRKKGSRGYPF
ncbi:hypothetical protein D3C73_885070 [compost metagenome]